MNVKIYQYNSPQGTMLLAARRGKLCLCDWAESKNLSANLKRISNGLKVTFIQPEPTATEKYRSKTVSLAAKQLDQYFKGKRKKFTLPIQFCGTKFQKEVWQALQTISYGTTFSYIDVAKRINAPKAARAVANVCSQNALSVIVPCHRVIGSDSDLTGYSGGLATKRFLLDIESPQQTLPFRKKRTKKY